MQENQMVIYNSWLLNIDLEEIFKIQIFDGSYQLPNKAKEHQ